MNVTTGKKYHDTTGLPQKGTSSDYHILTPVFQAGDMLSNSAAVMFNIHSERRRAQAIDYSIDCVRLLEEANEERETFAGENQESAYHQYVSSNCTTISEVIFLIQDSPGTRPASLSMYPILAYNDNINGSSVNDDTFTPELVGFVTAVHNWDTVLNIAATDKVNGILAVLSNGVESHSFLYENGAVKYLGNRDRHETEYESQRYEFEATQTSNVSPLLKSTPLTYTIALYPTDDWISMYEDNVPAFVCGIAVGLVVFTSLVFSLYDYLMNRNVNEKELILQTKRQFVRYISHEIRTPLNVVYLGFQLLCTEMMNVSHQYEYQKLEDFQNQDRDAKLLLLKEEDVTGSQKSTASLFHHQQQIYSNQCKNWLELIQDIVESADAAITVLNDLMSYDKLDTGTMVIQRDPLAIWDLVATTVHPFVVQARQKGIELELILQGLFIDENDDDCITRLASASLDGHPSARSREDSKARSLDDFDLELGSINTQIDNGVGGIDYTALSKEHELIAEHQVVLGDRPKLCQVVRNLVSNALKFTPTGGKVTIRACWRPRGLGEAFRMLTDDIAKCDPKTQESKQVVDIENYIGCGSLVFSVTDTGAGMSAENLSRLFQEGVQFNANKLQAGQGSGLGLWISKGIVELHRGRLSATSKGEGCGATFTLELPLLFPKSQVRRKDESTVIQSTFVDPESQG